jgi:signal transduction histidine kinase
MDGVLDDLREIARGLHPAILAQGGLRPALKALARRSAVPVDLDITSTGGCPIRSKSPPTTPSPKP